MFVDIFSSVKCVKVEKHCLTESSYSHMYYTQNMIQNSFSKTSRDNTLRQHNITHTHHTHQVNSAARTTTNILINWIFFFFVEWTLESFVCEMATDGHGSYFNYTAVVD